MKFRKRLESMLNKMSLLIVIVMLISIIGIIILIDNPILKAIFIVGITGYIYSGVT